MTHRLWAFLVIPIMLTGQKALADTVRYDLYIENKSINASGKKVVDFALQVNGSIPAPTLEFTEGDEAEITVHNKLIREEVSIHWHGILLPPLMDGVPYVNTPPIFPGKSFTFRFKIRQHGTYWYHSHTSVQEQKGVYGAFIIHPKEPTIQIDKELVVVLSDWSDENADQILNNLRKDGDYYQYKKKSIRSYFGAIGAKALGSHLYNEWIRMGGMDLSDVGYDAFLINGKNNQQLLEAHPGERIRIRIINAGASSYFYVSLGKLPIKVISADGVDIDPVDAREILMGMAETYDILFTVPEHKNYELRATGQDVTGFASGWIGMGEKVFADDKPRPNLYAGMNHDEHANHEQMNHHHEQREEMESRPVESVGTMEQKHEHHGHSMNATTEEPKQEAGGKNLQSAIDSLTVDDLRAKTRTDFSADHQVYDLKLVLGGNMERYIWHINGKAIYQDRNIEVKEGDVVRFTFENSTMMHHPMHLHGHFFRVLNKNKEFSPLKHTVDVPPHGKRVIEFLADEPGQWMLHCHNLYHLKTGMARVVKYMSYEPTGKMAEYDKQDPHLHNHIFTKGMLEAASNHAQANIEWTRTWDDLEIRFETRHYDSLDHAEGDLFYRRWFSRFFYLVGGGTYYTEQDRHPFRGTLGVGYTLPMQIETAVFVDHLGEFRIDADKRFQWFKYVYTDAEVTYRQNHDVEYEITLMFSNSWHWSVGAMFTEDSIGGGAEVRF